MKEKNRFQEIEEPKYKPSVMDQVLGDMASNLAKSKDEIMVKALDMFRPEWKSQDFARRGCIKIFPNQHEIFEYDGFALVEFIPPTSEIVHDSEYPSIKLVGGYTYRMLWP
jgi:hypothetical protein